MRRMGQLGAVKIIALYPKLATNPLGETHQAMVNTAQLYAEGVIQRGHLFVFDLKKNEIWTAADEEHRFRRLCLECGRWVGDKIAKTRVVNPGGAVNGVVTLRFCMHHPSKAPENSVAGAQA